MHQGLVGGVVEVWVLEVFNHGCHSLLTPSSLLFCFLFSFGSLFSTLIVVPPKDVTVLYNLCCVSASSFSVFFSHREIERGGVLSVQPQSAFMRMGGGIVTHVV